MSQAPPLILAVASPPGRSARGIIRLSGERCFAALDAMLRDPRGASIEFVRGMHAARMTLDGGDLPVLALLMPGPHSYTGEDCAELQLPGNPALLDRAMEALLRAARSQSIDARPAEPGEFTARAYLGGRMSLIEAEGVAATIAAESDAQLRAAAMLRSGALGTLAHRLADELASALALVEAGIDFTDQEDVVAIAPSTLLGRLRAIDRDITAQLDRAMGSEQLEAIPWVVLTGAPNAGKSTLFNALLGRERAVVSDVAGTTRDVITEPLEITTPHGRAEVMLVDLAGLDADPPAMNRLMQARAREAIDRAELILHCVPVREPPGERPEGAVLVRTKADGGTDASDEPAVSAATGAGLAALRDLIGRNLADRAVSLSAEALALGPRHDLALRDALDNVREAIALVEPSHEARHLPDPELVAASMRAALNHLGTLAGEITPDDVLGRIFAGFCIGK